MPSRCARLATLGLAADSATNTVSQPNTVTATVIGLDGAPLAGIPVTFRLLAGPNAGTTGLTDPADGLTGPDGRVRFTYIGAGGPGTDTVVATALLPEGVTIASPPVMTQWLDQPPAVVRLQRLGFRLHPTTLVLTFSEPLDAATAENLGDYHLVRARGDKKPGTRGGRSIPIRWVHYDAATLEVSLRPVQRLPLHRAFWLTVVGTPPSGLTNRFGTFLDGAGTGRHGSNYVIRVGG